VRARADRCTGQKRKRLRPGGIHKRTNRDGYLSSARPTAGPATASPTLNGSGL
jgi:hypothetical protein